MPIPEQSIANDCLMNEWMNEYPISSFSQEDLICRGNHDSNNTTTLVATFLKVGYRIPVDEFANTV